MNREILFRGKRVDNGEWVYGAFVPDALEMLKRARGLDGFIRRCNQESGEVEMFEVDRETVGQYTGLTDRNGVKIFEGDIVNTHYASVSETDFVEQIMFHNGKFCSAYKLPGGGKMWTNLPDGVPHLPQDKTPYMEWCEVIGNIHGNPEMMEVQNEENH